MPPAARQAGSRLAVWLVGISLFLVGAWHAVLMPLAPLARMELALQDLRMRGPADLPASARPHPQIVLVDIDEASLAERGHWPWPREQLSRLIRELSHRQHVAAIGVDLVFPEATPQDATFADALREAPVVLGCYVSSGADPASPGSRAGVLPDPWWAAPAAAASVSRSRPRWSGFAGNTPLLAAAAPAGGCFNVLPDADGLTRSVLAVVEVDGQIYPSLDLSLLHLMAGRPRVEAAWRPDGQLVALGWQGRDGLRRRWLLDERGQWLPDFAHRFRHVPAADVLGQRLAAGDLAGQVVIIGSSAPGLGDRRATPVDAAMPGAEVHAHMLASLLSGDAPSRPDWAPGWEVALIGLSLLVAGWAAQRPQAPRALLAGLGLLAVLLLAPVFLEHQTRLRLPSASALVLATLLFTGLTAHNYWQGWRSRLALEQLFRQYLPPAKARALARQPEQAVAEARMADLSVLFCDLRGFSGIAEKLPPLALRELLNHYFSTVTRLVHDEGGTLDKFIGDAVMAFWGAPEPLADHAARAVQTALRLLEELPALNQHLTALGLPEIGLGIGIATGPVCVGDLGSDLRRSYTAIGDAVNIAARLEALTRDQGVPLLVDEATRLACETRDARLTWLEVDCTHVKGRRQSVTIFTPMRPSVSGSPQQQVQARTWALALAAARGQDELNARAHLARLHHDLAVDPEPDPHWAATLQALSATLARRWTEPPPEHHP